MQNIYERWLQSGEDWTKSSWAISLIHTASHTRKGARRWMTRSQIGEKYSSLEIADEIIETKMQDESNKDQPQHKPHPDLPHREEPFTRIIASTFFWDIISLSPKPHHHLNTIDYNIINITEYQVMCAPRT